MRALKIVISVLTALLVIGGIVYAADNIQNEPLTDIYFDSETSWRDFLVLKRAEAGLSAQRHEADMFSPYNDELLVLSISSTFGEQGQTVSVTVSITENPGIWDVGFMLGFDPAKLEMTSRTNEMVNANVGLASGLVGPGILGVHFTHNLITANFINTGALLTVEFYVLETAEPGFTEIAIIETNSMTVSFVYVTVEHTPGTIEIFCSDTPWLTIITSNEPLVNVAGEYVELTIAAGNVPNNGVFPIRCTPTGVGQEFIINLPSVPEPDFLVVGTIEILNGTGNGTIRLTLVNRLNFSGPVSETQLLNLADRLVNR